MVKSALSLSRNLIISRLQQKELAQIKLHQKSSHAVKSLTRLSLEPLFDSLPINFGLTLSLVGGKIFDTEVRRQFFSHNLEETLPTLGFAHGMKAVERLEQTTPVFYQLAYQIAYEEMYGLTPKPDIAYIRAIALELSRLHHHLNTLEAIFYCLELDDMAKLTRYINNQMTPPAQLWFRVSPAQNTTPPSITYDELEIILEEMSLDFRDLEIQARENKKIKKRLHNKGFINLSMAGSYGLTGPFLHANGNAYDPFRKPGIQVHYPSPVKVWLEDGGDTYARFLVRLMECKACLTWLREALVLIKSQSVSFRPLTYDDHVPNQSPQKIYAQGDIAGPEGDIKASLFFNHANNSMFFSLRTSAYFITQAIPHLLHNLDLSDVSIMLYSLGITAPETDK